MSRDNDLAVLFAIRRASEKGGTRKVTIGRTVYTFEADTKVDERDEFYPVIVHRRTVSNQDTDPASRPAE